MLDRRVHRHPHPDQRDAPALTASIVGLFAAAASGSDREGAAAARVTAALLGWKPSDPGAAVAALTAMVGDVGSVVVADAISAASRELGERAADLEGWSILATAAARLHDVGCWLLSPAPLLTPELMQALADEAGGHNDSGPMLSAVAMSDAVADIASAAAGRALTPNGCCAYQHDSGEAIHLDRAEYPYVLHILLGSPGRLILHHAEQDEVVSVDVGAGALLAGRGTLHHWDEANTRVAIGLHRPPTNNATPR